MPSTPPLLTTLPFRLLACLAAAGTLAAMLGGCSVFHSEPGGVLTVSAADGSKTFAPGLTTGAYIASDADTADVYLSDLPPERFTSNRDPIAGATGNIVHIHIFLVPDAGSTPIDATACNFTVRHLVLSGGSAQSPVMGLYAGGGFLIPSGPLGTTASFGSGRINGAVSAASQRLSRASPGFTDLLGTARLSGRFTAPDDEELAKAISGKFETIVSMLPPAARIEDDRPASRKAPAKGADNKPKDARGAAPGAKKGDGSN
jgi:hypothetical protein